LLLNLPPLATRSVATNEATTRLFFLFNTKPFRPLAKKRLVKDYDALSEEIAKAVKQQYPTGYEQHLITYKDKDNKIVSALPFETDETYYLIRMTRLEAKRLVKDDEDYDDEGNLRQEMAEVDVDNEFDGQGEDDDDLADGSDDENDHIIVTRRRDDDEADDIADDSY
jgi:DNA-directed RNA polymerase subunit delta